MTRPPTSPWRRALPWLVLFVAILALLATSSDALARVGGGQGFSSGGGRSSGGGHGGGSSDGDLIWFVVWLVIEYPVVGIPVAIVVVGFLVVKHRQGGGGGGRRYVSHQQPLAPAPRSARRVDQDGVRTVDPNFSEVLFIDFAQLVYTRAQELRPAADAAPLRPYFAEKALQALRSGAEGLTGVRDVIFGSSRIVAASVTPRWTVIQVLFEVNLTEERGGEKKGGQQFHVQERWTFHRRAGALSPGPERMRTLSCAMCGNTAEARSDGTCPSCDAVRTGGNVQWEVSAIQPVMRRPLAAPELQLGGGVEAGTNLPSIVDPDLPARRRAFAARHPEHSWQEMNGQITGIFVKLQEAWSCQDWELARPYETDALFQVHRYWIERYRRFGLVNRLEQVQVRGIQIVKVDIDAFFESVTVRIQASMLDWTEQVDPNAPATKAPRPRGTVVGGSPKEPRAFSEYWTMVRVVGGKHRAADQWSVDNCPSCAAPLDNVNMAGVCGYCDSKITGGDYDWVLSRIEQDDVYAG